MSVELRALAKEVLDDNAVSRDDLCYGIECLVNEIEDIKGSEMIARTLFFEWRKDKFFKLKTPPQE